MTSTLRDKFLFTELSTDALSAGRWFDGLAAGTFTDMHGREVTFKPAEFAEYVANTKAAIAATQTEGGEVVGLPIDARDHDKGDGSGWIVDVSLAGENLIRLLPKWTELGRDLIGKGIRRFFSATVDTRNKVILGGTLTNWPATRNPKGQIMLRPIEMAAAARMFELEAVGHEDSINDQLEDVQEAWNKQFGYGMPMTCPQCAAPAPYDAEFCPACGCALPKFAVLVDVFDGYLIARAGGDDDLFKVTYTRGGVNNDEITFAPQAEWTSVKSTYVDQALNQIKKIARALGLMERPRKPKKLGEAEANPPVHLSQGDEVMSIKLSDLSEADRAELAKLVAAQVAPPAAPPAAPPVDLSQFMGVAALSEDGKAQLAAWMATQARTVKEQAELAFKAEMAKIQRENAVTELSQRVTGGSAEAPRGLKGVTATELAKHLLALPADEAKFFGDLLAGIVKDGLVEFRETGHGGRVDAVVELPAEIAAKLDDGTFKIADLASPILGLGDLKNYDLSKWAGK